MKLKLSGGKPDPIKVPLLFATVDGERQTVAFAMVRPASALEIKQVHAEAAFIARNLAEGAAAASDVAALIGEDAAGEPFDRFGAEAATRQLSLVLLAARCCESIDGVVDDEGNAVELSRGVLAMLLRDAVITDRFEVALGASLHKEADEKNALPPLPTGEGGAAAASAQPAG